MSASKLQTYVPADADRAAEYAAKFQKMVQQTVILYLRLEIISLLQQKGIVMNELGKSPLLRSFGRLLEPKKCLRRGL